MASTSTISADDFLNMFEPTGPSKSSGSIGADDFLNKFQPPSSENFTVAPHTAFPDRPIKAFARGAVQGATFDTMGKTGLENSALSPEGGAKTEAEKMAGSVGHFAGGAIPFILSDILTGTPAEALAVKFGWGPVRAAMAKAAASFGLYEADKGLAQEKPISEIAKNVGYGMAGGAVFGPAGYGAGKLRNYLGRDLAESEAQYFLGTPQAMAEKLQEQGKPSLAEQVLTDEPKLHGLKTRGQVRAEALGELKTEHDYTEKRLEGIQNDYETQLGEGQQEVQGILQKRQQEMRTPNVPEVNVPENQRLLPNNPPTMHPEVEPSPDTYAMPEPLASDFRKNASGEVVYVPKPDIITTQPGGATYDTLVGGRGIPVNSSGEGFSPPPRATPNMPGTDRVDESSLHKIPTPGFVGKREFTPLDTETPITKRISGSSVNLKGIVEDTVNELLGSAEKPGFKQTGNAAKARAVQMVGNNILKENGPVLDLLNANRLRSKLDSEVGKAYQSLGDAKLSPLVEAQMEIANGIRARMSELAPDIAKSLERQHRLLNVVSSLSPLTAKSGNVSAFSTTHSAIARAALGSRESYGLSQALRKTMGEPVPAISNTARQGARVGLAEYIDEHSQGNK